MTSTLAPAISASPIDHFRAPDLGATPAEQLREIRVRAPGFKEWFRSSGQVTAFAARSLVTLPYPKRFGLWEACNLPVPYVWMTNRMFVVQWQEEGRTKTLLAEPSDYELGIDTPFLKRSIERLPLKRDKALDTSSSDTGMWMSIWRICVSPQKTSITSRSTICTRKTSGG